MEVIYSKACGVDVHKSFIVAVICDSTSVTPKYLRKRFSTYNNSLIQFRNWLIDNDCQNYVWNLPASITFLYTMH